MLSNLTIVFFERAQVNHYSFSEARMRGSIDGMNARELIKLFLLVRRLVCVALIVAYMYKVYFLYNSTII